MQMHTTAGADAHRRRTRPPQRPHVAGKSGFVDPGTRGRPDAASAPCARTFRLRDLIDGVVDLLIGLTSGDSDCAAGAVAGLAGIPRLLTTTIVKDEW